MTNNQWWVALGLAGAFLLIQVYDRAKPAYDTWAVSKQIPAKRK